MAETIVWALREDAPRDRFSRGKGAVRKSGRRQHPSVVFPGRLHSGRHTQVDHKEVGRFKYGTWSHRLKPGTHFVTVDVRGRAFNEELRFGPGETVKIVLQDWYEATPRTRVERH